jgi:hypothetical protein
VCSIEFKLILAQLLKMILAKLLCFAFQVLSLSSSDDSGTESTVVTLVDSSLIYTLDDMGNRVPDFSRVGYHYGDDPLPNVPVVGTLYPSSQDDFDDTQVCIECTCFV